jgi:predicted phage terminase large subunit-like protein
MARLSQREFEAHLSETLQLCREQATAFEDRSEKARQARMQRAKKDWLYFGKTYLPHYFYDQWAPFHPKMVEAAQIQEQPVVIGAMAGAGKTSLITVLGALHAVLFRTAPFVVVGSLTEDLAAQFTALVKMELDENERIRQDFGVLKGYWRWEDRDFATRTGIRVKARGVGQPFRGLRWRQHRPTLVLLDDIEDEELIASPRRVQKALTWLLAVVLPRMEARGWRLILCGNVLSRSGVIGTLLFNPEHADWKRLIFPAETAKGKPTWPERYPAKTLEHLRRVLGWVRYSREFLCAPIDDTHMYQPDKTQFYPLSRVRDLRDIIVRIDPSVIESRKGDYKAIVGVGRLPEDHREYVCAVWIRHASVDAMIAACYRIWEQYHPKVFALEANGFQRLLKRDFDAAAKMRGFSLPIKLSTTRENKAVRIERQVALHDSGDLLFCREEGDTPLLLEQLYEWEPLGPAKDDGPDALAGALEERRGRPGPRFRSILRK